MKNITLKPFYVSGKLQITPFKKKGLPLGYKLVVTNDQNSSIKIRYCVEVNIFENLSTNIKNTYGTLAVVPFQTTLMS